MWLPILEEAIQNVENRRNFDEILSEFVNIKRNLGFMSENPMVSGDFDVEKADF